MKRLFATLLVVVLATLPLCAQHGPIQATITNRTVVWTLVVNTEISCPITAGDDKACVVTIPSTHAGNLLVGYAITATNHTIASVSGGGTWVLCGSSCQSGAIDGAYVLSATGGVTSVTMTINSDPSAFYAVDITEYSNSQGKTAVFDGGYKATASTCTTCTGISFAPTGYKDLLTMDVGADNNVTSISPSPWAFQTGLGDKIYADALNIFATSATSVVQDAPGNMQFSGMAFK